MINQLLITKDDLHGLVGKIFLSIDSDEHNLINPDNKRFVMEKRALILVSSEGKYGFAHLHDLYDIHFYEPDEFVEKINERTDEYRFYALATPKQLEQIQKWMMEDLIALT